MCVGIPPKAKEYSQKKEDVCKMKLKKLVATVACVAVACVFATGVFAKTTEEKRADAAAYLASAGISYDLSAVTDAQIESLTGQKSSLQAEADSLLAQLKADPSKAESLKNEAVSYLAGKGITVTEATVTVANGNVVISAKVNGTAASISVAAGTAVDDHGDIGPAKANGTWGVSSSTSAAASTLTSGASVIKATGDNAGMLLLAGVLAAVSVLGMAARKSNDVA